MKGGCGRKKGKRETDATQAGKLDAHRKLEKIQALSVDDCRIQRVDNSKPEER